MHGDIDTLIHYIARQFVFDAAQYPELSGASEAQKLRFAIRHLGLHFAKTAGKVVGVSEDSDHGDPLSIEELRKQVPKALSNALRLAALVGLSEADIVAALEEKYKEKIP